MYKVLSNFVLMGHLSNLITRFYLPSRLNHTDICSLNIHIRGFIFRTKNSYVELEDKTNIYAKEPWRLTHTETGFFEPNEWFYFAARTQVSENARAAKSKERRVRDVGKPFRSWEMFYPKVPVKWLGRRGVSVSSSKVRASLVVGPYITEYYLHDKFFATLKDHDYVSWLISVKRMVTFTSNFILL